jgi:hypothetical protein
MSVSRSLRRRRSTRAVPGTPLLVLTAIVIRAAAAAGQVPAVVEDEPSAAEIEQALAGQDAWVLIERGRIAMERGEPGQALDSFLRAKEAAARDVYPEADLAIADFWMGEGELAQAERSYLKALEGLRIAPFLVGYKEVDYGGLRVVILERLAGLHRLRESYGKMEEQYRAIAQLDQEYSSGTLADRITANFLEAGLNRVLTLYRLDSGFAVRAHHELAWLYYRNGLYERSVTHSLFAVTNILSAAFRELRRADPAYTFVSTEVVLRDGYRRANVRTYLEESRVWKALYYLAAASYARNAPTRAREIWGVLERSQDSGSYRALAMRQLAQPFVEPRLEEPAGAR